VSNVRKKGDFEYGKDAEKALLSLLTDQPKTTAELTREMQDQFFKKIHFYTVQRLLIKLSEEGKIKWKIVGRIQLWYY